MIKLKQLLFVGGMSLLLSAGANDLMAQNQGGGGRRQGGQGGQGGGGPGNFDPAQFQQRMMERYKERLEITDDAEFKAIQPLIQKVMDARTASMGGGRGMFGRGGPRGGGDQQDRYAGNPEAQTLNKAIESKASAADLKAALAKYLEARKVKQADLEKAQAELIKVLTPRQQAILTLEGML